jgi:hypothetical protein
MKSTQNHGDLACSMISLDISINFSKSSIDISKPANGRKMQKNTSSNSCNLKIQSVFF